MDFKEIIEPLRDLFKDEVRKAGLELGIPDYLVFRQPFPGPGLGIRIIGEVTEEKVRIVQDADAIYREEIARAMESGLIPKYGEEGTLGQYFAALTNMRSVGVMGDFRTYDYAVALPRRSHKRLYDSGSRTAAVGSPADRNHQDRQRGEARQSRCVRLHGKAARNDRV